MERELAGGGRKLFRKFLNYYRSQNFILSIVSMMSQLAASLVLEEADDFYAYVNHRTSSSKHPPHHYSIGLLLVGELLPRERR
jgi:hypothetical protein